MALPEDVNDVVYATDGYSAGVTNLSQVTMAHDNVFGDEDAASAPGGGEGGTPPSGGVGGAGGTPPSGAPQPTATSS